MSHVVGLVRNALPPLTEPLRVRVMDCTVMSTGMKPSSIAVRGSSVNVVSSPPSPGTRSVIGPDRMIELITTPPSGRATMPSRAGSGPVGSTR